MTDEESALLNQIAADRRKKGLRDREKIPFVGRPYDNEGSEKYTTTARPPRKKRKLIRMQG